MGVSDLTNCKPVLYLDIRSKNTTIAGFGGFYSARTISAVASGQSINKKSDAGSPRTLVPGPEAPAPL